MTNPRLCGCGCKTFLTRRRYPNGQLEAPSAFAAREYAGHICVGRARRQGLLRAAGDPQTSREHPLRTSKPETSRKPLKRPTALSTGLGPLQLFAMRSPAPKRHDLNAERESASERPEPSRAELLALLKVCLRLHEPFPECFEEAARAALPVRRVPNAGQSRAKWQA